MEVANHEDVVEVRKGHLAPDRVRRAKISGVVDTGATRLVLPRALVNQLGLPQAGKTTVQFADGRKAERAIVGDVEIELLGRTSVFTAIVEPKRVEALIGAIVLEELDLLADCTRRRLIARDPKQIFSEID
jgi:clan AA aspartic protease